MTIPDKADFNTRLARRILQNLLFPSLALFFPAGTLKFWQGWTFVAVSFAFPVILMIYFYKCDPQLLARRMLTGEKINAQKMVITLLRVLHIFAFMLAGMDYRVGWTRTYIGPVPWWLTLAALTVILGCHLWFIAVLKANRFAASIIQVETGQTIAATGPYRIVRHPMYLGIVVTWLVTAPALGSYVTLPAFLLIVPLLAFRLLNEEKFLRRELPGYPEYCRQTCYRLIPFVW